MKRLFGLLVGSLVVVAGLLATFGMPSIFGGSSATVASAAPTPQQIGMRVLLITDSANANAAISYGDWENTLQREGVPFTSVVTNSSSPGSVALPQLSTTAGDGTQVADYEGVVVAVSGQLGLTTAQWTELQTFEHQFSVRQVTAYATAGPDEGLTTDTAGGALPLGTQLTLTADGTKVFPYLNKVAVDSTQSTWAYQGTSAPAPGTSVDTLISGPGGSSLLGIYTSADGRQTMFQTFNENQYYLQSQLLRHGELDWLARNTYFGDQRNYLEMDIDDTFTPDDVWDTATHQIDYADADAMRMNPGDVATAATWEANHNFRLDQLFNMGGTAAYQADNGGTDPLLAAFQANCSSNCGPGNAGAGKPYSSSFGWISHTYDTPYLDAGCATQNYIEAELNENTSAAAAAAGGTAGTGGLGLATDDNGTTPLGAEDPHVFVPGNHSGFADLVPGNPATVDPPDLDTDLTTQSATGGTLAAGTYEYAVTDQFTNSSTPDSQSAAFVTPPIDVATGTTNEISLAWQAICHAADYVVYRGYTATQNATTGFAWTLLPAAAGSAYGAVSTPFDATSADTNNPASTTDVTGGGEPEITFTDTGAAGTATTEPSTSGENATESPWEQNEWFVPALEAVGITAVGADSSKPYPNPPDTQFGYGVSYTGGEYAANSTFLEGTAQVVPRHPVNIYYNAATDQQELDEYQTLYPAGSFACPTTCDFRDVIGQVVSGLFGTLMNNDPRPSYVHQTNIIGTPPSGSEESPDLLPPANYVPPATCTAGAPCTAGDGTLYQAMDPLLYEYNQYFNSSAPIEQLTEQAIANLLAQQQAWAATSGVIGSIEGNVVTVDNATGSSIWVPLTGTNIGTPYAGTQSGWTDQGPGTSTYTALAAWPAEPTNPVTITVPTGPAPGAPKGPTSTGPTSTAPTHQSPSQSTGYVVVQVRPKTVHMKNGKVTVSLKCEATKGKTPKGKLCTGKLSLAVKGFKHALTDKFRIKTGKTYRISIKVPNVAQAASNNEGKHHTYHVTLTISTNQSHGAPLKKHGTLTIKT